MSLWNIKDLPVPPINTYKAETANVDIKYLKEVFREGKNFFDNEKYMSAEYAVLSRIVYRMKLKFRSAKDFKALVKLHKALENYFNISISQDLRRFMELIPPSYTDETYLPNKNLLDFILVRLQGLAKLTERIVETCKITAYLFETRMHIGHFWKVGFIIFSLVSRIYILSKHIAKFICGFYAKIVPFSHQLRNNGRNWLPDDYILPSDLQKWMNVDWLDIDDEIQIVETSELSTVAQLFDLVEDDDDDIEFSDEYIMVNDEEDIELVREFRNLAEINIDRLRGFQTDEDVGEVIEVNDESLLQIETEENNTQAVIEASNTLETPQNTFVESGDDFGEVITINDSVQLSEVTFSESKTSTDITSVTISDNHLGSDSSEVKHSLSSEVIKTSLDCIIVSDETIIVPESPAVKERNKQKGPSKTEKKNLKRGRRELNMFKIEKSDSSTSLSKRNRHAANESDSENVILLSDSSVLDETVNKKAVRKKLKAKRKAFANSQVLKSRVNTNMPQNHRNNPVVNSNDKQKKKKKVKNGNNMNVALKNVQTVSAQPSRKRKLKNSSEKSSKKPKRNTSSIKEVPSFNNKPVNIKREFPTPSTTLSIKQETSFVRSTPLNIKQEFPARLSNTYRQDVKPVIVKTENGNSASCSKVGGTSKEKSKKPRKKKSKLMNKKVQVIEKNNSFKHISNKVHHYKSQDRNKNNISGKKKKNRNNKKNKKQMYF